MNVPLVAFQAKVAVSLFAEGMGCDLLPLQFLTYLYNVVKMEVSFRDIFSPPLRIFFNQI